MAIYRPSAPFAAISGRIGGLVAKNQGRSHILARIPTTSSPNSLIRRTRQASFLRALHAWQNLADAQRDSWRTWAASHPTPNRLGVSRLRTGQQAFLANYLVDELLDPPAHSDLPPTAILAPVSELTVSASLSLGLTISYHLPVSPSPQYTLISAARALALPSRTHLHRFVHLLTISSIDITATITDAYEAAFGPLQLGQTVSVKTVQDRPDYFPSVPAYYSTTVKS